jgi:hypothetical protein
MTFLELLRTLEARLGYHQLPLNPAAATLKNLFESSPLHHETMMRVVQAVYAGNRCRKLSDPVERTLTQEAIAPVRLELLQSKRTDVDLYHFIEELCVALDEAFGPTAPRPATVTTPHKADVIQLAPFRRGRRLKTSA